MFNTILKVFFLFIFLTSELLANCIFYKNDNKISQIELLNIEKSQNFFRNIGNFYLLDKKKAEEGKENINVKRRYNASIKVIYEDGNSCIHSSSIRFHGDFTDHIEMINGTPIPSLQVNLKNSNINNITKFILLRPKSRNFDNEIFNFHQLIWK